MVFTTNKFRAVQKTGRLTMRAFIYKMFFSVHRISCYNSRVSDAESLEIKAHSFHA